MSPPTTDASDMPSPASPDLAQDTGVDPRVPPMRLLAILGPDDERSPAHAPGPVSSPRRAPTPSFTLEQARAYCKGLALAHQENFSVLSALVPESLRADFAAVYAFCRWADDLGDETGSDDAARARATRLLEWWRRELDACAVSARGGLHAGEHAPQPEHAPAHPVYIALRETFRSHPALPVQPFRDLIDAFEQDQRVTRYQSWEELVGYCRRSADPVGRIVLALGGYADTPENAEIFRMSDATCTALQLINFWQDVRRDLFERDRVYLPAQLTGLTPEVLRAWADRPDDPGARVAYIRAVRPLVERTSELFATGRPLPGRLKPELAPVVWLFGAGGEAILSQVEHIGCATLWERPRLGKAHKLWLVARAWCMARVRGR